MYVIAPFLLNIFFAAIINVAYTCLKSGKDIMNALVQIDEGGIQRRGGATAGESVLGTSLRVMLYVNGAGESFRNRPDS